MEVERLARLLDLAKARRQAPVQFLKFRAHPAGTLSPVRRRTHLVRSLSEIGLLR